MMKRCTFTGLDENFSLEQLEILSSRYPFIEWGVLYSTSESPQLSSRRYPSQKWFEYHIEKIRNMAQQTGVGLSLHVCGKETQNLMKNVGFITYLLPYFDRVQINFRYKPAYKDLLLELFSDYSDIDFITQHNHANEKILASLGLISNHQILFDLSGGRGLLTENWPSPIENKICGYAGGLGPDNIATQLPLIQKISQGHHYWIDMESQLRSDEWLDYKKCQQVAKEVQNILSP